MRQRPKFELIRKLKLGSMSLSLSPSQHHLSVNSARPTYHRGRLWLHAFAMHLVTLSAIFLRAQYRESTSSATKRLWRFELEVLLCCRDRGSLRFSSLLFATSWELSSQPGVPPQRRSACRPARLPLSSACWARAETLASAQTSFNWSSVVATNEGRQFKCQLPSNSGVQARLPQRQQ